MKIFFGGFEPVMACEALFKLERHYCIFPSFPSTLNKRDDVTTNHNCVELLLSDYIATCHVLEKDEEIGGLIGAWVIKTISYLNVHIHSGFERGHTPCVEYIELDILTARSVTPACFCLVQHPISGDINGLETKMRKVAHIRFLLLH